MKTAWAAVPMVFLAILLIAAPAGQAADTAPSEWSAHFAPAVLLGSYFNGNVTGPVGGVFFIFLYAQPFNHSYPIYNQTFKLGANNTHLNVSLPTTTLTLGAYWVSVNGTDADGVTSTLYTGLLRVLDPLNATQVNEELYLLYEENQALQGQIAGLSSQVATYQVQADLLFWIFFTLFAVLLFKEGIQYYLSRRKDALKSARQGWTSFWTLPRIRTFSNMPVREAEILTPTSPNPERRFVTGIGDTPRDIRTEEEMLRYLARNGVLEPLKGHDYWEVEQRAAPPTRTREYQHQRNFKVDL